MAQSGKVTVWKGTYGFAVQESGQVVYVRADEIGGGRLRVGHTIQFDTVEADGHEGKLKGTNVSGEGVLKKGEMLVCGASFFFFFFPRPSCFSAFQLTLFHFALHLWCPYIKFTSHSLPRP